MIKIAHARISETGRITGKPGDQTGNEVSVTDIYERGWLYIFRPKYKYYANGIRDRAVMICNNDHVGYSQDTRLTLFQAWQQTGDFSEIDTDCNCDCSSFVAAILRSLKIYVPADMYTGIEKDCIEKTGFFETLIYSEKVVLSYGDILLADGHTAIVVENTETPEETAQGIRKKAMTDVYLRAWPEAVDDSIRGLIKEGEAVQVSNIAENGFVLCYQPIKRRCGFVSLKFLKE